MTVSLSSLGWDDRFASAYPLFDRPDHEPGRVVRADRGVCTVLTAGGTVRAGLGGPAMIAAAADPVALPCAGDWVALRHWPDARTTIESVLPRRSAVVRRTAGKDSTGQVLAANLDTVAVVASLDPGPEPATVERLLALAWESGAQPVLVLTKADLVADPAALADHLAELAPGVPVLPISAEHGYGLAALMPYVAPGRTLGLLGPSGVGKSTLVNALLGATVMTTQANRRVDGKGRHTTTYRALMPVPGGGAVLDTPGIRGVGLLDGEVGLEQTFSDVLAIITECRFADCGHGEEPGCAVREALADGALTGRRWESWCKLQRELAYESRRREDRLATAARRRGRQWERPPRFRL
ncbi:ribosome small subunit-dependent GTPase A [Catellatospora tritici]|uniref:ribosome small subunit-dependent GTPase A n=1 Tax=Catellatospora tritici TaxID=2851566 RepID=UPI001C2DDEA0|nr:ribosome small subunit-dependent GTPase A [Catellatospora tritici]MBV1852347.1 ribosome small subunit-dependent GTPase A [Catellatospora tritici]